MFQTSQNDPHYGKVIEVDGPVPSDTRRLFMTARFIAASVAVVSLTGANVALAANHRFALNDLADFKTFSTPDHSLTYSGTGYVGMTNDIWSGAGPSWMHGLTLEPAQFGRTLMQLDLAALAGRDIVSATLSFMLLDGQEAAGRNGVQVSGFDVIDGVMALQWDAPQHSHGSVFGEVERSTTQRQSIDITPLLDYSVRHEQLWLGLHLQATGDNYFYTATHDYPDLLSPDRAQVRIDVITAAVPEPQSWALLAAGLGVVGWIGRRRSTGAAPNGLSR